MSAYGGGVLLLAASAIVTFEVVARKFFNFSLAGADELSGYAYALSMAWGFSYALFCRAHIRVDAVYAWLPFRVRCILDVAAFLSLAALLALLSYRAILVFGDTLAFDAKANTPLSTPLWLPQSVWLIGILFFTACLFLLTFRTAAALLRGDLAKVQEITHGPAPASLDEALRETIGEVPEFDGAAGRER